MRNCNGSSLFGYEFYNIRSVVMSSNLRTLRSPITYTIHYFLTADDEIVASDTGLILTADLLFLVIGIIYTSTQKCLRQENRMNKSFELRHKWFFAKFP